MGFILSFVVVLIIGFAVAWLGDVCDDTFDDVFGD